MNEYPRTTSAFFTWIENEQDAINALDTGNKDIAEYEQWMAEYAQIVNPTIEQQFEYRQRVMELHFHYDYVQMVQDWYKHKYQGDL